METQSTKRGVLVAVAAVGALVGTALTAEPAIDFGAPTLEVAYGDLDLTSAQGVQALHRRLTAAAERVCPRSDGPNLKDKAAARECQKQAVERAVRAIGSPELAVLHAATAPRS